MQTVTTNYNLKDEKGEYALDRLDKQSLGYVQSLDFPIVGPDGQASHGRGFIKTLTIRSLVGDGGKNLLLPDMMN